MDVDTPGTSVERRRVSRLAVGVTALLLAGAAAAPAAADAGAASRDVRDLLRRAAPRAIDLGVPTASESVALAATPSGLVVGTTWTLDDDRRVFRWRGGQVRLLPTGEPPGTSVVQDVSGVNAHDQVLVSVRPTDRFDLRSVVVWEADGSVTRVSEPGVPTDGVGINEHGDVVVNLQDDRGLTVARTHGGVLQRVPDREQDYFGSAIDDRGWVVGQTRTPTDERHAFLWRDGDDVVELPEPSGAIASDAEGFTADGDVRGVVLLADLREVAVVWVDGRPPVASTDPCAGSRQVDVADHLPAGLRDRWPGGLGTLVLDDCPPRDLRTPRGGDGAVLGGNERGVHVGYGLLAGGTHVDPVAWVHGLAVPMQELRVTTADGAVALDVSDEGLVVGYQMHRWERGDTHPWATAVAWWLAPADPRR